MASGAIFAMRAVDKGFARQVRNLLGHFQEGNQAIKRVNEYSIGWLNAKAVENLHQRATRRAKDPRHGRLAGLIVDPSVSSANVDGFKWLIDAQMESADARVAAYARALDQGSDYWVRRTSGRGGSGLRLAFGTPEAPEPPTRGVSGETGFAPGPFGRVAITKPVPAYHWAQDPINTFRQQGIWVRQAKKELRALGLPVQEGRARSRA